MSNSVKHPFDLLAQIDKRSREQARLVTPVEQPAGMVVPMDEISEIIPVPSVTHIPGVKPWLMGVANLRGTVISVVNLRQFLFGKASPINAASRIIVVDVGDWSYGLLIDEVIGMRHFADASRLALDDKALLENAATGLSDTLKPYIIDAYSGEGHHWLVFDVDMLLENANFLDAAA